jgi:site-specific recombinase XerD
MNPPIKQRNRELRTREYMPLQEVEKVRKSAREDARHGHRNDTLILMMFRHALRVSEALTLRWEQEVAGLNLAIPTYHLVLI